MLRFYTSQQETRSVYILLTRSDTYFSKLIHKVTAEEYTHVSIALDPTLRHFYSFGRKSDIFMFPAGFVRETLQSGVFGRFQEMPCALYELQVPVPVYETIAQRMPKCSIQPMPITTTVWACCYVSLILRFSVNIIIFVLSLSPTFYSKAAPSNLKRQLP